MEKPATPIEDYALIGNCETAALVDAVGSIDWLCLPVFDSSTLFAALLDQERGGRFVVQPTIPFKVEREYDGDSAILVTRFVTERGTVALTDFFVTARCRDAGPLDFTRLHPTRKLVRLVEREDDANVPMEVRVEARPDYARQEPDWRRVAWGGYESREATLFCNVMMECEARDLRGRFAPAAGSPTFFVLDYADTRQAPTPSTVTEWLHTTQAFWREWNLFNTYRGTHERIVRRSAVTLKLLTYAPTGAFVAAPTSSLPEGIGGDLNWDYRYTWLRDSMLFSQALFGLGYSGEAQRFFEFLVRCWRKRIAEIGEDADQASLEVFYPIDGERRPPEEQTLDHLAGYCGSCPVRVGNRASKQFQLDNYGYVLQSFYFFQQTGGTLDEDTRRMLRRLTDEVLRFWEQPGNGVWEETEKRQFTYGKVMSWLALQRARDLLGDLDGRLEKTSATIRARVFAEGIRRNEHGEYLAVDFDRDAVDASEFLIVPSGILPLALARSTREEIERRLLAGPLLYRSEDSHEKEGAFLICSFWWINHLTQEKAIIRAQELMEQIIALASPLGLYAEEIDPRTGRFLGNFPQALSHLGLIQTLINLERCKRDPAYAPLPDHERFKRAVSYTVGWKGTLTRAFRVPRALRLLWHSDSRW